MSNRHALLIGIDHYFGYELPSPIGPVAYGHLGGCVRDIEKVEQFLLTRIKMDPDNIIKLTASLGQGQPREPREEWPTYRNMIAAFKELTNRAQAGDQVFIQYSGHGGRTSTMMEKIKGAGAFDEGLVPPDVGKPGDPDARYLRDFEMHNLIQDLVAKDVILTVIFDCCHSGGASRNFGKAVKRGISQPDLSPPPTDSAVGELPDLVRRWADDGAATTRNVSSDSSWLFNPKGYTLLAACRASESAYEFPFNGSESNGALTYWMLDTLGQPGLKTWKMVADRVAAKVHSQFDRQVPMLEGKGDIQVFGAEELESRFGVAVMDVEPNRRRVRIEAGEAHGLAADTRFAVFPNMLDADSPEKQLALIELTEIGATDSWANIIEPEGEVQVEVGSQAVMLSTSAVRVQQTVRVLVADPVLKSQVEAAIEADGQGFLTVGQEGDSADFLVDFHPERPTELVIQDTAGIELPQLNPPLLASESASIAMLVKRLIHLVQFRNVQGLEMPDAQMASKLSVEIEGGEKDRYRMGDRIKFNIKNTQEPNPSDPNDPHRILNVTVLALSSDWSVTQIYPSDARSFEPVDPGGSIPIELEAYLPDGQAMSRDIIKIFGTRTSTNFRWLELPSLDQPIERGGMRSISTDPLEQMLELMGKEEDEPQTRLVKMISSPDKDRGWTVSQKVIQVFEDG